MRCCIVGWEVKTLMAIDYVIDLPCTPKDTLTTPGILRRLKGRDRAAAIQKLYRDHGDNRAPAEMGFEMVRRLPDGTEETQVVVVQDMLNEIAELDPLAHYCEGCPANQLKLPFGCFSHINYPISRNAELWLLKQLPSPDEPLIFLLLSRTMRDFNFNNEHVAAMRDRPGVFFETAERFGKTLEDAQINTNQIFEMLFLSERIHPEHGVLLLLFFGAIPREIDAEALMDYSQPGTRQIAFLLKPESDDDESITALKGFFEALYIAHGLNVSLSLDV
jgi:hypothetical protein